MMLDAPTKPRVYWKTKRRWPLRGLPCLCIRCHCWSTLPEPAVCDECAVGNHDEPLNPLVF